MGCSTAVVDTKEMIMKSWITPHLFRIQLMGEEGGAIQTAVTYPLIFCLKF